MLPLHNSPTDKSYYILFFGKVKNIFAVFHIFSCFVKNYTCNFKTFMLLCILPWGRSSAGRALEWHSRGHGFDPHRLHQNGALNLKGAVFYILFGPVAQLGERTVRIRKVEGSIPFGSTKKTDLFLQVGFLTKSTLLWV